MSPRFVYENELSQLHQELEDMGRMIETSIEQALSALENLDYSLAKSVVAGDRAIDDIEKVIQARCLSLILKQQPVAKDLREVSTALKVVTDMERIGDHASDIAELVLRFKKKPDLKTVWHIPQMAEEAKIMVRNALQAFVTLNVEAANLVMKQDDVVDGLFDEVKKQVATAFKEHAEDTDEYIDLLMIAKYLERVGDHAVNICEWTEFCKTGELNKIKLI